MSDHLGEWWCSYCHYRAGSPFLWRKHLDNFHAGKDPRAITHIEPEGGYSCWVCTDNGKQTWFSNLEGLVAHFEHHHYSMLTAIPLAWGERIVTSAYNLLAFHRYLKEAGRE